MRARARALARIHAYCEIAVRFFRARYPPICSRRSAGDFHRVFALESYEIQSSVFGDSEVSYVCVRAHTRDVAIKLFRQSSFAGLSLGLAEINVKYWRGVNQDRRFAGRLTSLKIRNLDFSVTFLWL